MKLPQRFDVGVATHTGIVRSTNEDDYLLLAPPKGLPCELVVAIADGMGGVSGGAEASRSGLRGFASGLLAATTDAANQAALEAAMRQGFKTACNRVQEQASAVPALRDMGTTLTVLLFREQDLVIGHVGDCRAYRLRDSRLVQLNLDHASREQQNRLLRVIGGSQAEAAPDIERTHLMVGDRLLLCSDGVWSTVPDERLSELLGKSGAQAAADQILQQAIGAGGPDNGTALVVHVVQDRASGNWVDRQLPREESSRVVELSRQTRGPQRPAWPWFLLATALILFVLLCLQWFIGLDFWGWLRAQFYG